MRPFRYDRVFTAEAALELGATAGAKFIAGGTNLYDLMKDGVESPTALVDINRLKLSEINRCKGGGVTIGALVRNSDLANHAIIKAEYPLLSQALLSGASPQLRNMATTGGNLLQRTRCYYFADVGFPACNKRAPGSGCAAIGGFNRIHAILGQFEEGSTDGETCIATHPSDMCVALAALDASIDVRSRIGSRSIPIADFHKLPGSTPWIETTLRQDELIVSVSLPPAKFARNAYYLKARDRKSYAFALISVAAGLEISGGSVASAGLALGSVASKPWRVREAEAVLIGRPTTETFERAADILLRGAQSYKYNKFKVGLARDGVVKALTLATQGAGVEAMPTLSST